MTEKTSKRVLLVASAVSFAVTLYRLHKGWR